MHQSQRQVQTALHATAVGGDSLVESLADVDQFAQGAEPHLSLLAGEAVETTLQSQHLGAGLLLVQRSFLQGRADP